MCKCLSEKAEISLPVGRLAEVVDDGDVFAEVWAELDAILAYFVVLEHEVVTVSSHRSCGDDHFCT